MRVLPKASLDEKGDHLVILRALTILCVISSALISCNRSKYFRTTLAGREYPAGYDRNGDGITDIQAIKAQLNPADPNLASQDTDGDGLTNLWEFKLGFDPKVADSANSLNGNKFGGNGVTDCQEDLVGDGIPICWKIKNGIDPATGNRSLTDLDGDGYSDLEEYTAGTEATSANSRPGGGTADENGALAAVLTLKGTTSEYTEVTRVTGTMSYCASGEQVLFTSGATKPAINDTGFVACSTASDALTGTLAAVKTGTYKMYAWRKIGAGVVETPLSASILYAPRASDGGLSVNPYSNKTLSVALAAPPGTQYKSVRLFRYSELNCSSRTADDATGTEISAKISDSLILASGLSYTTPYCFKAFWKDAVGNVATRFGSYPGVGPIDGTLTISGYEEKTIKLGHTLPTDTNYSSLKINRFETLCAAIASDKIASIAMDKAATSFTDAGLKLATAYCYQAIWADAFGNGKTATVEYAGEGPTSPTLSVSKITDSSLTLAIKPPTSDYYDTASLNRFSSSSCVSSPTNLGTSLSIIKTDTSKTDTSKTDTNLTGLVSGGSYCYQMIWRDKFTNATIKTVRVIFSKPTFTSPALITLPDTNFASTSNFSVDLGAAYTTYGSILDVTPPSLTTLLSNGSGTTILSPTTVESGQSDLPSLTYSSNSNDCATPGMLPYVCLTPNVWNTSTSHITNTAKIAWSYTRFDQGDYDIKTTGFLRAFDSDIYRELNTTKVTIPNLLMPEEPVVHESSGSINYTGYSDPNTWFRYQPALALARDSNSSTARKQTYGIAYTASVGTNVHFLGKVAIDRDALKMVTDPFNETDTTSAIMLQGANDQANEDSVAIASSTASSSDWLVLSGIGANTSKRLQIAKISASNLAIARSWVSLQNNGSAFSSIAVTPAFSDHESPSVTTDRHGLAFAATSGSIKGVFVSKIRSVPSSIPTTNDFDTALYFDATNYYDANNRIKGSMPKAVEVTEGSNIDHDASLVQITTSNETGTNYFYVGWRDHTDAKVKFARIMADGTSSPLSSLAPTKPADHISNMGFSTTWGRAAYGMAAGLDAGTTPSPILGVLYAKDGTGIQNCMFRAYKYISANIQIEQVGTDTQVGTATDCRFPHLFWNAASKKFMAVWTEGGTGTIFGPTMYTEFTFNSVNSTPDLSGFTPVVVTTNRANRTINSNYTSVCKLAAQYDPGNNAATPPRIGIVTVESSDCELGDHADIRLDLYKPSR